MHEDIGLINYEISDENNKKIDKVRVREGKATFNIVVSIYNSLSYMKEFNVYLLIINRFDDTTVLAQQAHVKRNDDEDVFDLKFEINESISDADNLGIKISVTTKNPGEMGIGESIRVGTILNTKLPIEEG